MSGSAPPADDEVVAAWIADQLSDGECVWAGTNLPVPRAGMLLAHWTTCPNLRVLLSFYQHNFASGDPPAASEMFADGRLRYGAEMSVMNHRGEAFSHIRDIDAFFVGGLQVDREGNTNLIGIADEDGSRFKIRGAGPAGATSFAAESRRYYVYMTRHDPKVFVEECDFVSTVGPAGRRRHGLPGGGPEKVISPLGVLGFEDNLLRLEATMPGVSVGEVQAATGFDLAVASGVESLPLPGEDQLRVLRERVDPGGFLRGE